MFLAINEHPVEVKNTSAKKTFKTLVYSFKSPDIWKPALFLFLTAVTPGFGAVTSYYFENVLKFSAIQLTTASGVCSSLKMFLDGQIPQKGFVRQESLSWNNFLDNKYGRVYA